MYTTRVDKNIQLKVPEIMTSFQASERDLCFLRELGDSRTGISMRYEIYEMYGISLDELERQLRHLENLDAAGASTTTSSIESE